MISSVLFLEVKYNLIDRFSMTIKTMLKDTRDFEGNAGVKLYHDGKNKFTLIVDWVDQKYYEKYKSWREKK